MPKLNKFLSLILSFCLILEQSVFAQAIDLSRYLNNPVKSALQSDKFRPLHLRYISYDNQANDFKILLDKGDYAKRLSQQGTVLDSKLEQETQELMKYFFIGLSLPNEKFWVNLRPDSPDYILDPDLEKTDIGRIFLEADLQLKKDTSGMTSPQTKEGREYWDKLYKKAGELFGTENITIPTITRPWIVPDEIIIRESPDNAYIYKATLKVMLEEDYLTSRGGSRTAPTYQQYAFSDPRLKELNEYSTQLIKEAIIPKLTYAVNTAKRYAPLRQVYYSLILAQWFKQKYGNVRSIRATGILPVRQAGSAPVNSYIDLIDSGNLAKLISNQPYDKQSYFRQYQKSFKDGEYNLQEPVYTPMGQSIRRYVSGGIVVSSPVFTTIENKDGYNLNRPYLESVHYGVVSSSLNPKDISDVKNTAIANPMPGINLGSMHVQEMLKRFNTLDALNLDYGLISGKIGIREERFGTVLRDILTENGFEVSVANRLRQTFTRMKKDSLEILVITGVITEDEKNIFVSKDESKLKALDNQAHKEFAGRLKRLYDSYKQNVGESLQERMLKRLIPLEIVEPLSLEYTTSRANIIQIIAKHPDFPIWLPKAKLKVEQTKDRVGGPSNAWRIVMGYGIDKVDNWLILAEEKVNSIKDRVVGSARAWDIVMGYGIDKVDDWLILAEEKVNSIKDRVGGLANAWTIVINQGIDKVDDWFSKAEEKVNSIKDRVGGLANAWTIVINQGIDKVDDWFSKAEEKVNSIKDRVGGPRNAWRIVMGYGIDKVDDWFSKAEEKVNSIKDRVGGLANAWIIVTRHGIDKVDDWLILAEEKVNSIKDRVGGPTNAWYVIIRQGIDKVDSWLILAEKKVNGIKDRAGGPNNAWRIVIRHGVDRVDALLKFNDEDGIFGSTSSPLAVDDKGGIAFNSLPIQTESVASSALGIFPEAVAFKGDLDEEWGKIQSIFNAGVRPSIQRLSEYTAAAAASPLAEDKIDQVRVMLADILRRDEESERSAPAEEFCKQLLRALEAE